MNPERPSIPAAGRLAAVIFFGAFAFYLRSSAPALAPYRDMGEMVAVSKTLGIAHPPGYPLYAMAGKIAALVPAGTASYRLGALSAFFGALACAFFALFLLRLGLSPGIICLGVLFWLGSTGFLTISVVTEMYSANLAAAAFLLYLWAGKKDSPGPRAVYLIAFCAALFLGFRLDLALLGPALLAWAVHSLRRGPHRPHWGRVLAVSGLFFALGFSVYLFLWVRSLQEPLLNWNSPDSAARLWSSLLRKTHGGTLDLLSTNYAPGELFWTDLGIYVRDAASQFTWAGLVLAVLGLAVLARRDARTFAVTFLGWLFAGPFFIYKANMPPNPHALAILEAHFNLPNLFLCAWIAVGLDAAVRRVSGGSRRARTAALCAAGLLLLFWVQARSGPASKRHDYFGVDYGRNVLRSLPRGAILVMKKDVQLFIFWALQYAEGARPDVSVVARGLAGSPWYIRMREGRGAGLRLGPLRGEEDFARFIAENPGRRVL